MVTIIPRVIQAEIISVEEIFIIVATSPTVINSVTLRTLLSASTWAISSSDFWRCWDLLSLRYLAPFDFVVLPWSFSRVSRICFWTSSSVGSSFFIGTIRFFGLLLPFKLLLDGFMSLLILLRFLFLASSTVFSFLLTSSKFIVCPVFFGPDNFLYLVVKVSLSSSLLSTSVSDIESSFKTVVSVTCPLDVSILSEDDESILFCLSVFCAMILDSGLFSWGVFVSFFGGFFKASKSIFPRDFGFSKEIRLVFNSSLLAILSSRSCSFFSWMIRRDSFSFLFSSPTSWEATFFDLSFSNSSKSIS